ncbi:MAG TPA: aminopeptidase P family protein [Sedimentisphaerales bacterium]|nr:aminopeptidase P family protein [Sedimentisphaerales bacterium]
MDGEIIDRRVKAVQSRLRKSRIGCMIVTKPANVSYATGFLGDDSWAVITSRDVYLLTDSRYVEQAQNECPRCRIIQRAGPMAGAVGKLIKQLKSVHTVHVESSTSLAAFGALKKTVGSRLKTASDIIGLLRMIKGSSEIAAVRAASRIAGQALRETLRHVKVGMSENELAGVLDLEIRKLGARNSFETIVAFGPNASRPHHQPGRRKLKRNDTILIDFGAKHRNYCCDLTRCFVVGKPPALYRKVYRAVQEAQAAAIKMIKAGVEVRQVDATARKVIAEHNLPVYGHGTGHGLGLEVHEEPVVSQEGKGKLQAGMVFTIEPGVYIPGKLGVRIEDDILVTNRGYKILSSGCPHLPFLGL